MKDTRIFHLYSSVFMYKSRFDLKIPAGLIFFAVVAVFLVSIFSAKTTVVAQTTLIPSVVLTKSFNSTTGITTLSWQTSNVSQCVLKHSPNADETIPSSIYALSNGSKNVDFDQKNTSGAFIAVGGYVIECDGVNGSASAKTAVVVACTPESLSKVQLAVTEPEFSSKPNYVSYGKTAKLQWTADYVQKCSLIPDTTFISGAVLPTSAQSVGSTKTGEVRSGIIFADTTYTLLCNWFYGPLDKNAERRSLVSFVVVSPLTINIEGSGTVVEPASGTTNLNCSAVNGVKASGSICSANYTVGYVNYLKATPAAGYVFSGWKETGVTDPLNFFTIPNEGLTRTAVFTLIPPVLNPVTIKIEGTGNVTEATGGINCSATNSVTTSGSICAGNYAVGSVVIPTAKAGTNYVFSGWKESNAIVSSFASYSFMMPNAPRTLTAVFTYVPIQYSLSINVSGGTVTSDVSPLDGVSRVCAGSCVMKFTENTAVTLSGTANLSYQNATWSGGGSGGSDGKYRLSMNGNKSVSVNFSGQAFDFSLSNNGDVIVTQGSMGVNDITVTKTNTTGEVSRPVSLSYSILPSVQSPLMIGYSYSSITPTVGSGFSTTEFVSASTVTVPQIYTVTVTGSATRSDNTVINRSTSFKVQVNAKNNRLKVSVSGGGTVTGLNINCPAGACFYDFSPTSQPTMTATAGKGYVFVGWSGDCTGTGACSPLMNVPRSITASFLPVIDFSCSGSPMANVYKSVTLVTWKALNVTGGEVSVYSPTSYAFNWGGTDGLSGGAESVVRTYSLTGSKTASLTISSKLYPALLSTTKNCSNTVTVEEVTRTVTVTTIGCAVYDYSSNVGKYCQSVGNLQNKCSFGYTLGSSATFNGYPNSGNSNVQWSGDGSGTWSRTVYVDADKNLQAYCQPLQCSLSLNASPSTVDYGGAATLSWSAYNASTVNASAVPANSNWTGEKTAWYGTISTGGLASSIINDFYMNGEGAGGSCSQVSARVCVNPATPVISSVSSYYQFSCMPSGTTGIATITWSRAPLASSYEIRRNGSVIASGIVCNTVSCTYYDTGLSAASVNSYTVTAVNSCNGMSQSKTSSTTSVTVVPPCIPSFSCSGTPSTGLLVGDSVTWTASGIGSSGYAFSWSGTDGLSGYSPSVVKKYTTSGGKSAALTVTSPYFSRVESCGIVLVNNPPPVTPIYPENTLHVGIIGEGSVKDSDGKINCSWTGAGVCRFTYSATSTPALTATPATGYEFVDWSNDEVLADCSGGSCNPKMTVERHVTVIFKAVAPIPFKVNLTAPSCVSSGSSPAIVWTSNADSCSLKVGSTEVGSGVNFSGTVPTISTQTTYGLTCKKTPETPYSGSKTVSVAASTPSASLSTGGCSSDQNTNKILVKWTPVANATGYELSIASGGSVRTADPNDFMCISTLCIYVDYGTTPGASYTYSLKALSASGCADSELWSGSIQAPLHCAITASCSANPTSIPVGGYVNYSVYPSSGYTYIWHLYGSSAWSYDYSAGVTYNNAGWHYASVDVIPDGYTASQYEGSLNISCPSVSTTNPPPSVSLTTVDGFHEKKVPYSTTLPLSYTISGMKAGDSCTIVGPSGFNGLTSNIILQPTISQNYSSITGTVSTGQMSFVNTLEADGTKVNYVLSCSTTDDYGRYINKQDVVTITITDIPEPKLTLTVDPITLKFVGISAESNKVDVETVETNNYPYDSVVLSACIIPKGSDDCVSGSAAPDPQTGTATYTSIIDNQTVSLIFGKNNLSKGTPNTTLHLVSKKPITDGVYQVQITAIGTVKPGNATVSKTVVKNADLKVTNFNPSFLEI